MRKRQPKGKPKPNCKCGKLKRKGGRYCNDCHAAYMRKNRPKHSELSDEQRMKANARAYLKEYVKRGHVKKLPCEKCGNENSEGHHEDYSKPLDVKWLCREHHLEVHKKSPAIKRRGLTHQESKPENNYEPFVFKVATVSAL
jgi:hypothetical protein